MTIKTFENKFYFFSRFRTFLCKNGYFDSFGAQIWVLVASLMLKYCNNDETHLMLSYITIRTSQNIFCTFLMDCVRLVAKNSYFDPFGGPNMGVSGLTTDDIL